MEHLTFITKLAKARHPLSQFIWGMSISAITISLEFFLWAWLGPTPYILLPMGVVAGSFFGGGLIAGFTSTLLLSLYAFSFPTVHPWIPQLVFFIAASVGTVIIDRVQKTIRELAGAEAEKQAAQRLSFAAAAAQLGIWEWDIKKDFLTWDEQMLAFYGINREAFTGQVSSWQKGLHPDDVERATQVLEEAIKGERNFDLEFRVVHPDGTIRTIKANGLVIRDEAGNPSKMFGLNRDVTDEKKTIEQINELKAYFEAALRQSQAGIIIADAPKGLLRFANPAALEIAGALDIQNYDRWQITDLKGVPIPHSELPLAKAINEGETSSKELIVTRPNQEKRVVISKTAPIRREDGSIMSGISVLMDITEQQKLMEELKSAREAAEVAMRAKAKFLDIAAHELRTPVTAVSLLAQLTQRQVDRGETADPSLLNRMRVQLDRLSRLVVDLLEVSKLDRGALELRYELTDLKTLVSDCQSTFQFQFPNRVIQFTSPTESVELMVDPIRIYEVISNLLDNAIKYSPGNSPIELSLETEPHYVRFSIRDHGPGLSIESKRKLFSAFERGNANENTSGLGLGLFICRGIVGLHKGTIGVDSKPGAGSTFYFDLPRIKSFGKTA